MKQKPKSGVIILIGGRFNKKIIYDAEILKLTEYNIFYFKNVPVYHPQIDCDIPPKLYKYIKTEQTDKYGRKIYEYVNKRTTTEDGVRQEFKNNKEVISLEQKFQRVKRDMEVNGKNYNPYIRDMLMVEYNDILKKLMDINEL